MQRDVRMAEPVLHHAVHRDRHIVDVGVHHTFWAPGGARRVDQRRQMARRRHRPWRVVVDRLFSDRIEVMMARRHVRRVVCAGDEIVHAADSFLHFEHVWREIAPVDQHTRAGILQHDGRLAGSEAEIERHGDCTENLAREISRDRVLGCRHIERDAVARADAEVGEPLRETPHARVPLAIRPATVLENKRGVIRIAFRRLNEDRCDVHGARARDVTVAA